MATIAVAGVAAVAGVGAGSSAVTLAALAAAQAAAAYIDSQVIFPELFGQGAGQDSPRIDNITVGRSEEGSGVRYNLGPQNRVTGTIIWMSPVTEHGDRVEGDSPLIGPTPSSKFYEYYADVAVAIGEGELEDIDAIRANAQTIYDASRDPGVDYTKCKYIRFHRGDQTQEPEPRIQAREGTQRTPGYRGTAYIFIRQLYLNDYGSTIPTFTFTLKAQAELSQAQAVSRVLQRAGYQPEDYDVSRLRGCVRGLGNAGPRPNAQLLEVIQAGYDISARYTDNVLTFFPTGSGAIVRIDPADLGAYTDGNGDRPGLTISDIATEEVPTSVATNYIDAQNDFQPGSQIATREDQPTGTNNETFDLPLVLTAAEALAAGTRRLWRYESERFQVTMLLPPKYAYINEGDVLLVPQAEDILTCRVNTISRGANYQIEIEAVLQESITFEDADLVYGTDAAPSGPGTKDDIYQPFENPFLFLLDIPAVFPGHEDDVRLYYAVTIPVSTFQWAGGNLFLLNAADDFYTEVEPYTTEGVTGFTAFALEDGVTGGYYMDRGAELEVTLYEGELFSVTESDVLDGANLALVGDEIIAFTNAEFLGDQRYKLTGLLRGLRGTRNAMLNHVAGERFVDLGRQFLETLDIADGDIGQPRVYKAVNFGGDIELSGARSVTPTGRSIRPMPPTHIRGQRLANGDLVITWLEVTKAFQRVLRSGSIVMSPTDSRYNIRIMNGESTYVREAEVGETSYTYAAADREADLQTGPKVTVRLRRRGDLGTVSEYIEATL